MGSLGTLFATMLVAVTYGWMPASSDETGESAATSASNGYEYLVQVGPEDLRALAEGRVSSLSSATPEGMKSIDRVRIVFGEGDLPRQLTAVDRTSPKRISKTAVKHKVAKPIVSDWLPARGEGAVTETGQRHTVYQRPGYQNPGSLGDAMQRGFQEGTRQITDAVRNAPQNVGNYANQTARDLGQGTRGVVEGALGGLRNSVQAGADGLGNAANNAVNLGNKPYFDRRQQEQNPQRSQTNGTTAGAQQPGFTPFSYEKQPALVDSQNSHAGHDHAGHNHQPNTNLNRQPVDTRNQGPALPSASGRPATDNGIATQFGSGANNDPGYRRNEADRGYNNDSRNNDYRNDDRRNDVDRNHDRDLYVNRRDEGRMTPVARDSNLRGPLDDFGTRRDDTRRNEDYRNPSRNAFDDWRAPTVDSRRPAAPDSWDIPPLNPQQPVNQTAGFGTPNTSQAASPEVASWGDGGTNTNYNANPNPNVNPNGGFANNGANNGGQQSASFSNPANDLLFFLLLAGSLAGNLYVVTSYLDVRNKYRSALRQGPGGYRNAA